MPVGVLRSGKLSEFREEFYRSLRRRADALFELADAVLCTGGPVTSLVGLSLAAQHRRGHGALYDAVNSGVVEVDRLPVSRAAHAVTRRCGGPGPAVVQEPSPATAAATARSTPTARPR
jgi:hypothetical protein